jgi:anti-sigma regulatory factor (Ser/Thr protein kinase)
VDDLKDARAQGVLLAKQLGFGGGSLTIVASAFSELSRFIVENSKRGEICAQRIEQVDRHAIQFSLMIHGPASGKQTADRTEDDHLPPDITRIRSMMDEFEIVSPTCIMMKKWFRSFKN